MMEFLESIGKTSWWLSVVVVGVLVNFLSQALYPQLARIPAKWAENATKLASARQAEKDADIAALKKDLTRLPLYLAREFRHYWLALFLLCMAIALLLFSTALPKVLPTQFQVLSSVLLGPAAVLFFFALSTAREGLSLLEITRAATRGESDASSH
jgi:hypothetical protein